VTLCDPMQMTLRSCAMEYFVNDYTVPFLPSVTLKLQKCCVVKQLSCTICCGFLSPYY